MAELDALIAEQEDLQLRGKTERTRCLTDYASMLDWTDFQQKDKQNYTKAFDHIIDTILSDHKSAVWVDLGCGNGAAMRCAKAALENRGIDPARLHTYGYDLLPVDMDAIKDYIRRWPTHYPSRIVDQNYAPMVINSPAETATFPERPHLVTALNSLMWMRDPLQAFANAARQAPIGAYLSMNRANHLLYTETPTGMAYDSQLFSPFVFRDREIPGFRLKGESRFGNTINLQKTKNIDDYAFGMALRDPPAKRSGDGTGFSYLYCKKELIAR